jgi:Tol biopolymer transport system component
VRLRPISGGDARAITTDGVRQGAAQVSPDGRRIAYSSFDDQKRAAITVCDFPSCASKRTFPLTVVAWTPDSQGLAYLSGPSEISIQPLDGGAARHLTHLPANGQTLWGAAFAPDGRLAVGMASIKSNIVLFRGLRTTLP